MSSLPPYVWINGNVVPTGEARVSPFDHGLIVGDGVFETLLMREGKFVGLKEHWQRLTRSCTTLDMPAPNLELMEKALREVMAATGLTDNARLRFTVTSGDGPMGSDRGNSQPTVLAIATALNRWGPVERVQVVPWTRNENGALAGIKSTSYADNVRALAYAKARGAGEGLLANTRGELCEGTGSNVFMVADGSIVTPPLESGCLAGITRAFAIEACAEAGLPLVERAIPLAEFEAAGEAFLTSSTRDVHPIAAINGRELPQAPGELTKQAAAALSKRLLNS